MIRSFRWWSSSALVVAAITLATPVRAAHPGLERVVLLPAVDRSSVVIELSAPPQNVSTRRINDAVVEVEAGPFDSHPVAQGKPVDARGKAVEAAAATAGTDNLGPRVLKAPGNVRFVDSVTVRVMQTAAGPVVRARIALSSMAQTVVRSSGRRVYVDVSAVQKTAPAASSTAASAAAAVRTAPAAPPAAAPEQAFREGIRPSLDKLMELAPFLTSAAASGDARVIGALLPGLLSVRDSLAAQQPADAARGSHTMVVGAVDRIIRGLSADFTGDRVATVKQSLTTIDVVGGVLAGE